MKLEHLKDKPIAILGAGGVGKPMAADCALEGKQVRIWDQPAFAEKNLAHTQRSGIRLQGPQLNLFDFQRSGTGYVELATDNLAEAVKGAGNIVITTVALAHEALFRELIPLLEDGQVIHLVPDNWGTLLLRKMMREMGCAKQVIVGGWATSPYGARVLNKGGVVTNIVNIIDRVILNRGAALPATDTGAFIESARYIPAFDCAREGLGLQAGDTVIDNTLSNGNPVIHIPGVILGVSTMQNFETVLGKKLQDYSMYSHSLCPAIAEVASVFWEEEVAIAKAMGVGIMHLEKHQFFARSSMYGNEYMGPDYKIPFEENYPEKYGDGPRSLENRYIIEDVPVGCYIYQQLARRYGVETPILDAMINLACVMIGRDLRQGGYTLDYLGIGHMDHGQLHKWLREGVYTA